MRKKEEIIRKILLSRLDLLRGDTNLIIRIFGEIFPQRKFQIGGGGAGWGAG